MRTILLQAILVSSSLSLLSLFGPPYVYSDQALQLNCVQAWNQGHTSFPNQLLSADPTDLMRDRLQWELWHPFGFPLLIAGLTSLGLSIGSSIHLLAVLCFIAGCTGWSLWALHFPLPRFVHLAIPFLIPGIRYGNDNLVHFHAEAFLFAATPWALIMTLSFLKNHPSPAQGVASGVAAAVPSGRWLPLFAFTLGLLCLLKYSAVFLATGILLALFIQKKPRQIRSLAAFLPIVFLAFFPLLLLSLLNRINGGAENLVTASLHPHLAVGAFLFLLGSIPLTLADAGQIVETVFLHPHSGLYPHAWIVSCLGLPGAAFLCVLFFRSQTFSTATRLAFVLLTTHVVLLLGIWTLCDGVGYDRRYLAPPALALLPWVLTASLQFLSTSQKILRFLTIGFLIGYILLPVLYGYGTLAIKLRDSSHYLSAESGLWNPLLTPRDGKSIGAYLNQRAGPNDIWYLPEPILALDLHGRKIFGRPDWEHARTDDREISSRPARILALVPKTTPDFSARTVLLQAFPQSRSWLRESVPNANYDLWTSDLRP